MSDVGLAEIVGYLQSEIDRLEKRTESIAAAADAKSVILEARLKELEANSKNAGMAANNAIDRCDFIEENISTVLDYAMYWQDQVDKSDK